MEFDNFEAYYSNAGVAKAYGNSREAKRLYLLSAKALLEISLTVEGELRNAIVRRADRISAYARTFPVYMDKEVASTKKAKASPSSSEDAETKFTAVEIPDVSFDDVAGLDAVKDAVRTRAIYPIQYAEVYRTFDKDTGGGVLMYGLPGTGKTMIAMAIAHETGAKFFSVRCSDIVSKWFGEAEKNIKKLFETAQKEKCSVIFFDEFESIASKRGGNSSVMPRIVGELLSQIQGFSAKEKENTLLLLAATNRPWDIDSAFLRSGRFSELLYIPLPDFEARKHILLRKFKAKPVPVEDGVDFEDIAKRTDGFNGADVAEFCDKCKEYPIKRCIQNNGKIDGQCVTKADIEETLKNFHSSVQKQDIKKLEDFKAQYD